MKAGSIRLLVVALLIAEICASLEVTMVYTALPSLTREFGSPAGAGWVITACLLGSAVAAALCGRLGDLYGRRAVLLVVIAVTASGSLTSALSPGLGGVIAGAALQGFSGAILPLCLALVRERVPAERVPTTVGFVLAAATGGAAIGLALGGALIDRFGWQSIFWASGGWALLALLLVWRWTAPDSPAARASSEGLDMIQGVLFAPAIAALLLALTLAKDHALGDPRVFGTAAVAIAILVFWARHQLAQRNPLIDLRLLADRRIATTYFCMAMVGMGMMQHTLIMSMLLQQPIETAFGFGLAAGAAGLLLMPVRLIGVVASPVSGKLAARYGPRRTLLIGCALAIAGWVTILLFPGMLPAVLAGMVLEGTGFSVAYVAIPIILLQAAPPERAGEVTGLSAVVRAAFSAAGAQIVMVILASETSSVPGSTARFPTAAGYALGIGFILLACAACALSAWYGRDGAPRRETP